ncbi:MAG: endo alpha-1,4 polygalactosaminidase, partial [Acidimicrobiales bacterium]
MKRLVLVVVALLLLSSTPSSASTSDSHQAPFVAGSTQERLDGVQSWAFAIGTGQLRRLSTRRLRRFDLVIVDGEQASARKVARLQRGNTLVLAYLSVGTIEAGREWFDDAKPHRLELWEDWGEWFADVDSAEFRALLV